MIVTTFTVVVPEQDVYMAQVVIGPFRFSLENMKTAFFALLISSVVIMIVSFFFKNAESDESKKYETSFLNAYRRANGKLHFDNSVLGRYFVPPAEEALQYNNYFLPKQCVYVGWFILLMAVAVACYFVYAFSDAWELIKSEEWMSTIFMSFLCSIMFTEVLKVS